MFPPEEITGVLGSHESGRGGMRFYEIKKAGVEIYENIYTSVSGGKHPFLNLELTVHKLPCPIQSKLRLGGGF